MGCGSTPTTKEQQPGPPPEENIKSDGNIQIKQCNQQENKFVPEQPPNRVALPPKKENKIQEEMCYEESPPQPIKENKVQEENCYEGPPPQPIKENKYQGDKPSMTCPTITYKNLNKQNPAPINQNRIQEESCIEGEAPQEKKRIEKEAHQEEKCFEGEAHQEERCIEKEAPQGERCIEGEAPLPISLGKKIKEGLPDYYPTTVQPPIKLIDKGKVEKVIGSAPTKLPDLIKFFQDSSLNNPEKAYGVFKWIALHIKIDVAGVKNKKSTNNSPEEVCKSRLATSEGYAKLLDYIFDELSIDHAIVTGWIKGEDYDPQQRLGDPNHFWNMIGFVPGVYYLVDCMFAAGRIENNNFVPAFDDFYFCPDPYAMIRSHCPLEDDRQMLDQLMPKPAFEDLLSFESSVFKLGIRQVIPERGMLYMEKDLKVQVFYESGTPNAFSAKLFTKEKSEIKGAIVSNSKPGNFELTVTFPKVGYYQLNIYGSKANETQQLLFFYLIQSSNE